MSDIDDNEEELEEKEDGGSPVLLYVLLAIVFVALFSGSIVVVAIFYILFRFVRLRVSVIAFIGIIIDAICLVFWNVLSVGDRISFIFSNISDLKGMASYFIPVVIIVNVMIGPILGIIFVGIQVRNMKNNPQRRFNPGHWNYKFQYRRTPIEYFKRKKSIEELKNGALGNSKCAPLGIQDEYDFDNNKYLNNEVYRYYSEAKMHTLIVGATGSGKTVTQLSLMLNDIKNSISVCFIDFKASPDNANKISLLCKENGINFYHFVNGDPKEYKIENSNGQCFYDPLSSGSTTAKADMTLGMREYDVSAAVYKTNMQEILQVIFSALNLADKKKAPHILWNNGDLYKLASAIGVYRGKGSGAINLIELSEACEGTQVESAINTITQKATGKTKTSHAIEELQGQLRTLLESDYGNWLKLSENQDYNINLFKLLSEPNNFVLFSIDSDSEPDFAKYVGALILQDLTNVSAARRSLSSDRNLCMVYVDEFQSVTPSTVKSLLEKSRESSMCVTLAQQSFGQIIERATASGTDGNAYLTSIMDTCSNFIVHAGSVQDSAERLSKIVGLDKKTIYKQTNKNNSSWFSFNWRNKRNQVIATSQEDDWKIPPRAFMNLSIPSEGNNYKSTAVVINKSISDPHYKNASGAVARITEMVTCKDVLRSTHKANISSSSVNVISSTDKEDDDDFYTQNDDSDNNMFAPVQELDWNAQKDDDDEAYYSVPNEEDEGGFVIEETDEDVDDEEDVISNIHVVDNKPSVKRVSSNMFKEYQQQSNNNSQKEANVKPAKTGDKKAPVKMPKLNIK